MKFAYADPPYHGLGQKLYGGLHKDAHDWDSKNTHFDLLHSLAEDYPDGWVLSCNPRDLSWLLPFVPEDYRLAAWVKTYHQIRVNVPVQYAWEPVIFCGGRPVLKRKPLVRDWHMSGTHMSDPTLIGSKPPAFCRWVLELLGFDPDQDELDDLFPGSNVMARTIETYSRQEALL